jgi:hypothetical protein
LGPEALESAGPGLREVCEAIGIPPVLHLGSCVDNTRILTVASQMATEGGLGEDIGDLPAVGLAPEWMSEKALSIGTYFVASGVYVIFGTKNPVSGSEEIQRLISEGWEEKVGGKLEFILDAETMVEKTLEHIDKKRAELGLVEYDPTRFGQSGDVPLEQFFAVPPEERNLYSQGLCPGWRLASRIVGNRHDRRISIADRTRLRTAGSRLPGFEPGTIQGRRAYQCPDTSLPGLYVEPT